MRNHLLIPCGLLAVLVSACGATPKASIDPNAPDPALPLWEMTFVPDLPVAHPPYDHVDASWKQRMGTPYIYFEHFGNYNDTGALIPSLHREMLAQGLKPAGPPFSLFYDDPAGTPIAELRSRACIPIGGPRSPRAPLKYEVLPEDTVVYAFVSGPYPDVPRAYPGVWNFLERMNWSIDGPIRHVYMVPPGENPEPDALLCEIQVPAAQVP
jgi:effector-binding domain-containing protein